MAGTGNAAKSNTHQLKTDEQPMHLQDDELVLRYYGELSAADEARMSAHLADCAACQAGYTRLQQVLAAVEAMPAPALPDGFERTVWARLAPALPGPRSNWLTWFVFSPARLAWAAALVILVGASFFAGRVSQRTAPAEIASAVPTGDLRERVLLTDVGEHLDRSQMMLVELVSGGGDESVDLTLDRQRAEDLIAANRLYRQTATATGDSALTELLDELERVLVELAASPVELSGEDGEKVRSRIDAKGLLFKVRVVSSAVRERQKEQIRTRTGQSS